MIKRYICIGLLSLLLAACGTGIKGLNLETKDGQKIGCVPTKNDTQICRVEDGKGNIVEMEIENDVEKSN